MKYHFEPKKGWMNDPNGLVFFNNRYHAFFQHNPHDNVWGPMHWGHAVSDDLVHWEEQEIALYPDMDYEDDGGCFSGSAIVKDGRLYLIYTSVSKRYGQAQSIAFSDDGIHFTKYNNNPVIAHYPEDATADFRDPKVFAYDDGYRMIVGTKYNGHGRIVQYGSKDLLSWDYVGVLFDDVNYDNVIECPDLYEIDGQWVLMYSKIGMANCREQFIIGHYDGYCFREVTRCTPEYGPQFYAAQSFEAGGRRILIGWFYDWDIKGDKSAQSAGTLTIPREVRIAEGKIRLYPVAPQLMETIEDKYSDEKLSVDITQGQRLIIKCPVLKEAIVWEGTVRKLEMLKDGDSAEIFINDGEMNFSLNYSNLEVDII